MGLKSVEIQGFKSFKDKIKLNFDNPITAIVGPNGSGKSNISDAILWVLGEQSAKNLRGNKMQDVIFAGTQKEKAVNFAQVSITFENDLWKDIDYQEITVTRRVFRTGESEYYINKNQVRLKDVKELFLNTGIGKEGYSVIGQGKIDEILSSKSEDRRELFEEASGISKQKYIKEQSVKKLEQTNENLLRIEDILVSQIDRLKYLEKESSKAKKGMVLEEQLKEMEIQKAILDIEKLSITLSDVIDKKEINDQSLIEIKSKLVEYENKRNELLENINKIDIDVELKISSLNDIKSQKIKNESDIQLNDERLKNSKSELERLTEENENSSLEVKNLITKIDNVRKTIEDSEKKIEEINSNLETYNIDDFENELNIKKQLSEKKSEDLNRLQSIYTQHIIEKSSRDAIEKERLKEISEIRKHKEESELKLNRLEEELRNYETIISDFDKSLRDLNNDKEQIYSIINEKEEYLLNLRDKLSSLKEESITNKNKYLFLKNTIDNHEGYNFTVQNFFKKLNNKLHEKVIGTLGDLISVDKKYEKSVDAIMSSAFQNIIVRNENDGKELINFLKINKIGRLTFLPLNKIKPRNLNYVNDNLVLGHLNQFIKSDEKYRDIIDYFAQKTLVTENMDDAISVSSRYKNFRIVTLDGDIINSWGSMVGGYKKTSNYSILSTKNSLNTAKSIYENCVNEYNTLKKSYDENIDIIDKNKCDLEIIVDKIGKLRNEIDDSNSNIKDKQFEIKYLKSNINDFNLKLDTNTSQTEVDDLQETDLKNQINELECDLKTINVEIEKLQEKYNSDKMNMISLKSEYSSNKRDLNIFNNQLNDAIIRKDYLEDNIKSNSIKIDEINKNISQYTINRNDIESKTVDYDDVISKLNSEILDMKSSLNDFKASLSSIEQSIYDSNASVQKTEINNNSLIEKALNTTEKLNNIKIDINELYDINIDTIDSNPDIKISQKEINKITNDLRNIGSFSVDSIQEYESVKREFDFMTKNKNDLIESREDIMSAINKLNREMKEVFTNKFEEINTKFVAIFKQLFNGGYASLKLTEDDVLNSGIEITAQPPGKKLQSLNLLSGGERSLTAVALLFAIFETRPSSFCILDEIDAALDEINIKRYKEYLIKFKEKTQFIIITHRKSTMEIANILYGISMEKDGISKMIKLDVDRREIC
ncbi:MAG: chromosome segregation protein SMC [Finegoldia magna]|uniref:Chromosome partition protein Smc n=2 Tax=Finegoldia magna TaxID=1260 RepID=E1KVF9_FINMA|nr:chromosome segregation protein SMC [Finegoldia magna]EFK93883.1 chromosome segregation protein SMC [Finegoldia magna ACS-171-V-Col3]EFL54967.1 chromosome segregation protein SMC [Finegoldia magna BVS033A4]MDU5185502.1 chromosome segregation protein SMC [Finegoldia magna]MDU5525924.1 chromosome segregation protein SMC [Finegoldia magna]